MKVKNVYLGVPDRGQTALLYIIYNSGKMRWLEKIEIHPQLVKKVLDFSGGWWYIKKAVAIDSLALSKL